MFTYVLRESGISPVNYERLFGLWQLGLRMFGHGKGGGGGGGNDIPFIDILRSSFHVVLTSRCLYVI